MISNNYHAISAKMAIGLQAFIHLVYGSNQTMKLDKLRRPVYYLLIEVVSKPS
jgi:hypothetical protein